MPDIRIRKRWPMWLVVVGGRSADFFMRESRSADLQQVQRIESDDARLREQDRISDDAGRTFDSAGYGRHKLEPKTTRKRQDQIDFVDRIAHAMERAFDTHRFASVAIAAPPRILGELRATVSTPLRDHIVCEIAKDLSRALPQAVRQEVDSVMKPRNNYGAQPL